MSGHRSSGAVALGAARHLGLCIAGERNERFGGCGKHPICKATIANFVYIQSPPCSPLRVPHPYVASVSIASWTQLHSWDTPTRACGKCIAKKTRNPSAHIHKQQSSNTTLLCTLYTTYDPSQRTTSAIKKQSHQCLVYKIQYIAPVDAV